jgi:hypothetical protein
MPLVLTLRPGDRFAVGLTQVLVRSVIAADRFVLSVAEQEYQVGSQGWARILPGCDVRSTLPDDPGRKSKTIRVQVNAPEHVVYRVRRVIGGLHGND